jgi:hypothetical protein
MRATWFALLFVAIMLICSSADKSITVSSGDSDSQSVVQSAYASPSAGDRVKELPNQRSEDVQYETVIEDFDIVAPSGNRVYGMIRRPNPNVYPNVRFAAVIFVQGGMNPGRLDAAASREAIMLSEAGMVIVCFNAEGRGDVAHGDKVSEGTEDYNGFRHQDSLAALVEYVSGLEYVIAQNIGVRTSSYGITMTAGCVGRYPDLPVAYIVDEEGPSNSFVTAHEPWALFSPPSHPSHDKYLQVYRMMGHYSTYRDSSAENIAFWEQREADRFIGNFRGKYLRLQATWDHAQPPSQPDEMVMFNKPPLWWQAKHTADMVNAAVNGGVPWVRVNLPEQGNQVNVKYDVDHRPAYLPGMLKDKPYGVRGVLEMARMTGPTSSTTAGKTSTTSLIAATSAMKTSEAETDPFAQIPGFSVESIMAGILVGIAALAILRKRTVKH